MTVTSRRPASGKVAEATEQRRRSSGPLAASHKRRSACGNRLLNSHRPLDDLDGNTSKRGKHRDLFWLEFAVGLVAFAGVLAAGVLAGVIVGVLLALLLIIKHLGRPPTALLGRTPAGTFADIAEGKDAAAIPGMLIWQPGATNCRVSPR